ncbi:hypothetical protein C8J57DRAFT_1667415 [Mycena rebaudengoi]|nr:hypothetical protein C8J57DRAFT_1667415 [Mycena rebaudengoi]
MSSQKAITKEPIQGMEKAPRRLNWFKTFVAGVATIWVVFGFHHGYRARCAAGHNARKIGSVKWASECSPGVRCGSVIVPKDYFDAVAGTASVAIAVFKATKFPKKGTVFLNPGGPGGSGTGLATQFFADIIGHDWDLLGFDPRAHHRLRCFDSAMDFSFFTANTVLEQGFTVTSSSNLSNPAIEAQLVEQSRQFLALKKSQAELCAKNMGDELRYMGTATVVRDMDFMAKLFDGEDAKINYWGGSYGSILALLLMYLKWPPQWSIAATAYSQAMAGHGTLLFNKLANRISQATPRYDLVRLAVTCLDSPPPKSAADMLTPEDLAAEFLKTMRDVSPHFGPSVSVGEPDGGCQYWPVRGLERFTGPWNATLEWPMLIVSNTMDPISAVSELRAESPIESGLRINSLVRDSTRLIIQDGPGHGSTAIPTLCTTKLVRGYFEGKLPENGTVCDTSFDFFPDPSKDTAEAVLLDEDERRLLESARAVGALLQELSGK